MGKKNSKTEASAPPEPETEDATQETNDGISAVKMDPPPAYNNVAFNPPSSPIQQPQPTFVLPAQQQSQPNIIVVGNNNQTGGKCPYCNGTIALTDSTGKLVAIILCIIFCCPIGLCMLCCMKYSNIPRCTSCGKVIK